MDAILPEVGREGVFELPGLRHPLIPADECVANDLRVGRDFSVLLLSGPNAGGKTVALKSVALAALMVRAGLHVPADPGARVDLVDRVLADIGDDQDIQESLSTFSARDGQPGRHPARTRGPTRSCVSTRSASEPTPPKARPSRRRRSRPWPTPVPGSSRRPTTTC